MSAVSNQQYLTSQQVLARYGRRNQVWLWRLVKQGKFPAPAFHLNNRKYWLLSAIEAHEREAAKASAPVPAFQDTAA